MRLSEAIRRLEDGEVLEANVGRLSPHSFDVKMEDGLIYTRDRYNSWSKWDDLFMNLAEWEFSTKEASPRDPMNYNRQRIKTLLQHITDRQDFLKPEHVRAFADLLETMKNILEYPHD